MSSCTTQGITVAARTFYLETKSRPRENQFVFGYEISITNQSDSAIQLLDRHWFITNEFGQTQEVVGEGVVGLQPLIEPGETFTYNSYCELDTHYGFMKGIYGMIRTNGQRFRVAIAPFVLMPSWMLN